MANLGCRNTLPIGCPSCRVKLVCFLRRNHPGDCYDAQEHVWWHHVVANIPEPRLLSTVRSGRD